MPFADPALPTAASPAFAARRIADLADQCVQCGLCLPHCPTYRVAGNEAESPRGRIALARALAAGTLATTASATLHLDHCLSCMSCERVCPSHVQYGELLHEVRSLQPVNSPISRFLQPWLARPARLRAAVSLSRFVRPERWLPVLLQRLAPQSMLAKMAKELPASPASISLPNSASAMGATPSRGRIGVFLGCVASAYDRDTHAATVKLLVALGYDVEIPVQQGCCGALAQHAGRMGDAQAMAAITRAAFADARLDAVLVSASGCMATLRDLTLADSGSAVHDALTFIAADTALPSLRFRALPKKVALHIPCTQAGLAGATASMRQLLGRIPSLQMAALDEQPRCCGASGSYFLDYPEIAEPLRTAKLNQIEALGPDLVLSANIGCRLYLGNGLRQRGSPLQLVHPLTVLAQQLESA